MTNERAKAHMNLAVQNKDDTAQPHATTVSGMLEAYKPQIMAALPSHMTADRMLRIVLTEIRKVPKLGRADARSLFGAVIQAAQLGLEPGGALGHCYLLPYENRSKGIIEAQLMIGYRGMVDLSRRSGLVSYIEARIVYNGEHFKPVYGLHPDLIHEPNIDADEDEFGPEDVRGAYAIAVYKDGNRQYEWMSRAKIEKNRARSRAKDNGPWVTDYEEMCKKTAVRRLWKLLPVSIEMHDTVARATDLDTRVDLGLTQSNEDIIEGTVRAPLMDPPTPDEGEGAAAAEELGV